MDLKTNGAIERWRTVWSSSLAQLISGLTGSDWTAHVLESGSQTTCDVWVGVSVSKQTAGVQRMALGIKDAAAILTLFTGETAEISGELDDIQQEALTEFIRQWVGLIQTALKPDFGEVTLDVNFPGEMAPANEALALLQAEDGARSLQVLLQFNEELVGALSEIEADQSVAPSLAPAKASAGIAQLLREGNLELLLDLELPVSLRFGSRKSTLGELLELATGAVLELDREVGQPVDMVINDIVVARGEVVVVDGDYGLRITELGSPRQRIGSLLDVKCGDRTESR
jgi:flagellar motor switch protein FliN